MELTLIGLATKIGYVAVIGATSILANTLITYHHNYKLNSKKQGGGDKNESKSHNEKLKELRRLHSAD